MLYISMMEKKTCKYYGKTEEDKFVLNVTKNKHNGFFIDIYPNDPIIENSTFSLEKEFGWNGLVLIPPDPLLNDKNNLEYYQQKRRDVCLSTQIKDLKLIFSQNEVPNEIDYLSVNVDVDNGDALQIIETLEREILRDYKFTVIVFRHDIYKTIKKHTRDVSRLILNRNGYELLFEDVASINNMDVYQDWYVCKSLTDENQREAWRRKNVGKYQYNRISGHSINYMFIEYE